ncbi:Uncharacterised protein [Escherichia coli]|uniref:Uncharacterized protein n=1 Tax=Escherichia coli TaxID=562 RepID=A0A484Z2H8_ECOLX|nr:Uncharacterised protein [Escherichia coli]
MNIPEWLSPLTRELISGFCWWAAPFGLSPLVRELSKHNLLLINYFLSQSQSTNFTVSHKQHIHYVKEHLIH